MNKLIKYSIIPSLIFSFSSFGQTLVYQENIECPIGNVLCETAAYSLALMEMRIREKSQISEQEVHRCDPCLSQSYCNWSDRNKLSKFLYCLQNSLDPILCGSGFNSKSEKCFLALTAQLDSMESPQQDEQAYFI